MRNLCGSYVSVMHNLFTYKKEYFGNCYKLNTKTPFKDTYVKSFVPKLAYLESDGILKRWDFLRGL